MLVLLVIFMVTAPMMQQGLNVNLPQARRADPIERAADLRDDPGGLPAAPVRADRRGTGAARGAGERVRQAILPRNDKSLFIRMDAAVTAQDIYTVFDELKRAGVEKVALAARAEGRHASVQEAVSAILHDRARQSDGISRMLRSRSARTSLIVAASG